MFSVQKGPIFGQIVLADEINRATPKTQSALLEAMAEHAVTIAGTRHVLEEPFFVLATENPIEMEGTYPLPEAQLDRFLLKVVVPQSERRRARATCSRARRGTRKERRRACSDADGVLQLRGLCRDIAVAEPVVRYAARLVRASDPSAKDAPELVKKGVRFGAACAARSRSCSRRRRSRCAKGARTFRSTTFKKSRSPRFVIASIRSFEGEADGMTTDAIVDALLTAVPTRPPQVAAEQKAQA